MSSLWTPGGEHNVPRDPEPAVGAPTDLEPEMEDAIAASLPDGITLDDLSPEQLAQAEEAIREMAAVREQVLSAPAGDVIANHAMGLFELGALHLSQQTPNFAEAGLAIDVEADLLLGEGVAAAHAPDAQRLHAVGGAAAQGHTDIEGVGDVEETDSIVGALFA